MSQSQLNDRAENKTFEMSNFPHAVTYTHPPVIPPAPTPAFSFAPPPPVVPPFEQSYTKNTTKRKYASRDTSEDSSKPYEVSSTKIEYQDNSIGIGILPAGFPEELSFRAAAIYALLRTLSRELRLSPFSPEVFLRSLYLPYPSRLMGQIHVALLRHLLPTLGYTYRIRGMARTKKSTIDSTVYDLRGGDNLTYLDPYTWPLFYDDYVQLTSDILKARIHDSNRHWDFRCQALQNDEEEHYPSNLHKSDEKDQTENSPQQLSRTIQGRGYGLPTRSGRVITRDRHSVVTKPSQSKIKVTPPGPQRRKRKLDDEEDSEPSDTTDTDDEDFHVQKLPQVNYPATTEAKPGRGRPRKTAGNPTKPSPRESVGRSSRRESSSSQKIILPDDWTKVFSPKYGTSKIIGEISSISPFQSTHISKVITTGRNRERNYDNNSPAINPIARANGIEGQNQTPLQIPELQIPKFELPLVSNIVKRGRGRPRKHLPLSSKLIAPSCSLSNVEDIINRPNLAPSQNNSTTISLEDNLSVTPQPDFKDIVSSKLLTESTETPMENTHKINLSPKPDIVLNNDGSKKFQVLPTTWFGGPFQMPLPRPGIPSELPYRVVSNTTAVKPVPKIQRLVVSEEVADALERFANPMSSRSPQKLDTDVIDTIDSINVEENHVTSPDYQNVNDDTSSLIHEDWPHFHSIPKLRQGIPHYRLALIDKIHILEFLLDELLTLDYISAEFSQREIRLSGSNEPFGILPTERELEELENDDECAICGLEGDLLCCDGCPASYHRRCIGLFELDALPEGRWMCPECEIKDPAMFGNLKGGRKASVDWFTITQLQGIRRIEQTGDENHNNSHLVPTTSDTPLPSTQVSIVDKTCNAEFSCPMILIHGYMFQKLDKSNLSCNAREIEIPECSSPSILKCDEMLNLFRTLDQSMTKIWPLAQIPLDSKSIWETEMNKMDVDPPRNIDLSEKSYDPSKYQSIYSRAPAPLIISMGALTPEYDLMKRDYESVCCTIDTRTLSHTLTKSMSHDDSVAKVLRSNPIIFSPYSMASTYMEKLEALLKRAGLLSAFWTLRNKNFKRDVWRKNVLKCRSINRLSRLLVSLIDATHPLAFSNEWFQSPIIRTGKPLREDNATYRTLPSDFNPATLKAAKKWEQCSDNNLLSLLSSESSNLSRVFHLTDRESKNIGRKRKGKRQGGSHTSFTRSVDGDRISISENTVSTSAMVLDESSTVITRPSHESNDSMEEHMDENAGSLEQSNSRTRRSKRSVQENDDMGLEEMANVVLTGIDAEYQRAKAARIKELEASVGQPFEKQGHWSVCGRHFFDPAGYLSPSDMKHLGRRAGTVLAPFVTYSKAYEVGQGAMCHLWRKACLDNNSLEGLLFQIRILRSYLEDDVVFGCESAMRRGSKNVPKSIVCSTRDFANGEMIHFVYQKAKSRGCWLSARKLDATTYVHEHGRRKAKIQAPWQEKFAVEQKRIQILKEKALAAKQAEIAKQEEIMRREEKARQEEKERQDARVRQEEKERQDARVRQEEILSQKERLRQEEVKRQNERLRQEEVKRQKERARQEEIARQKEKLQEIERCKEVARRETLALRDTSSRQVAMKSNETFSHHDPHVIQNASLMQINNQRRDAGLNSKPVPSLDTFDGKNRFLSQTANTGFFETHQPSNYAYGYNSGGMHSSYHQPQQQSVHLQTNSSHDSQQSYVVTSEGKRISEVQRCKSEFESILKNHKAATDHLFCQCLSKGLPNIPETAVHDLRTHSLSRLREVNINLGSLMGSILTDEHLKKIILDIEELSKRALNGNFQRSTLFHDQSSIQNQPLQLYHQPINFGRNFDPKSYNVQNFAEKKDTQMIIQDLSPSAVSQQSNSFLQRHPTMGTRAHLGNSTGGDLEHVRDGTQFVPVRQGHGINEVPCSTLFPPESLTFQTHTQNDFPQGNLPIPFGQRLPNSHGIASWHHSDQQPQRVCEDSLRISEGQTVLSHQQVSQDLNIDLDFEPRSLEEMNYKNTEV
jgi:PHD-finger